MIHYISLWPICNGFLLQSFSLMWLFNATSICWCNYSYNLDIGSPRSDNLFWEANGDKLWQQYVQIIFLVNFWVLSNFKHNLPSAISSLAVFILNSISCCARLISGIMFNNLSLTCSTSESVLTVSAFSTGYSWDSSFTTQSMVCGKK